MAIRSTGLLALAVFVMWTASGSVALAQRPASKAAVRSEVQTATSAKAELVKGKLNPAQSKPGDNVSLRLNDDVKSNGEVVLKKGTVVTGVVRNVKQIDSKNSVSGSAQSMMEIEWLVPATQASGKSRVMVALQSFTQISPLYQEDDSTTSPDGLRPANAAAATRPAAGGAGLGGLVGVGVAGSAAAGGLVSAVEMTSSSSVNGQTNTALMSMPSIVAVEPKTTSALQSDFGFSDQQQIYKTGRGEMITGTGARQSVDIFSRMSNDTVITSQNKNFEIGTGAQMQLLFGVEKK